MNKLDFNDFAPLFGPWADLFKPFIESQELYEIYQKLKSDSERSRIFPESQNVFNAFRYSHPQNIKVVWLLMDPYPGCYHDGKPHATGIALDCSNSNSGLIQPSLNKFYEGIEDDLGITVKKEKNLSFLVEQGVLLLNTDLTHLKGYKDAHRKLWEPFHKFFFKEIMSKYYGMQYVLSGLESRRLEPILKPVVEKTYSNLYITEHPCTAHYARRAWEHNGIFTELKDRLGPLEIMWDYDKYLKFKEEELPF